ncbi:MAG: T9SS type B sorting domain-containing protein [Ferruginibacter sp.]
MRIKKYLFLFLLIALSCFLQQRTNGQCTTPINTFPYNEGFEANDGGWVTGTSAAVPSDWEWGSPVIPIKTVITSAGSGNKCWVVGGLSKNSYNDGERSWLQSPCFDISSLSNPQVSFKVFWETERKYDGAAFEFSTDGGLTFNLLGSINSNGNCSGQNWFNYNPVNFLGGPGWSGNIQSTSGSCQGSGGSGGWLTAKHSLAVAAGSTGIIFRFTFAAGITCNTYDGFAIDDVEIGEAPVNSADFTFTCNANNTVAFSSSSVGCKSGVLWDFADAASGANNSSTLDNPTHTFSAPGNFAVSLTTNFISGPSVVVVKIINVITASVVVTSPIKCAGDQTGAIMVNVNPAGSYNYAWDTNPVQTTASLTNLSAGTYTVTITGAGTCSTSLPYILTEPAGLTLETTSVDATCGMNNGSITTVTMGGTLPYNYLWSNSAITASINNLSPGSYSLLLKDANGCSLNTPNLLINNVVNNVSVSLGADRLICPGQTLVLNPGNFSSYKWQDNSTASTYTVTSTGVYSVTVTDVAGCMGSATVKITVDCSEIFFPSAFTPNGDTKNDGFGPLPLTILSSLSQYKLTVYGRWGEVIFTTTDPFIKWDGTYKGKDLPTQVFTWTATYIQKNLQKELQKGTVSIIR